MNSVLANAAAGMRAASIAFARHAEDVVAATTAVNQPDAADAAPALEPAVVGLITSKHAFAASAAVARTADDMTGILLDIVS